MQLYRLKFLLCFSLNETFETALIAAAEYLNENLYDKTSKFIEDTGSLDTTIKDLSIKYKDGSLTPDNKSAIFTVKSGDIEFDIRLILPVGKSLITIDHVYVDPSKVSSDIVADSSLKDSILFMDEITQLSPYQWAVI